MTPGGELGQVSGSPHAEFTNISVELGGAWPTEVFDAGWATVDGWFVGAVPASDREQRPIAVIVIDTEPNVDMFAEFDVPVPDKLDYQSTLRRADVAWASGSPVVDVLMDTSEPMAARLVTGRPDWAPDNTL